MGPVALKPQRRGCFSDSFQLSERPAKNNHTRNSTWDDFGVAQPRGRWMDQMTFGCSFYSLDTSFINKNLLNTYYVPGTMLGTGDAIVTKVHGPCPHGGLSLMRKSQPTSAPTTSPAPVGVSRFCFCAMALCSVLCLAWHILYYNYHVFSCFLTRFGILETRITSLSPELSTLSGPL